MKSFVFSIILIIVLTSVIVFNMLYIKNATDNMKELIIAVAKEESSDSMSELISYWRKHKDRISLSANFKQTDIVSEELIKLNEAVKFQNRLAIQQSCAVLRDALDDIGQYETPSFNSIF